MMTGVAMAGEQRGLASFYHEPQRVACGGRFNPRALTAAHRTLPCGTKVTVTNIRNNRKGILTIDDRGPWTGGRIIDVSQFAAELLDMIGPGVVPVRVEW